MCYLPKIAWQIGVQKMADLAKERAEEAPPFPYCGLDIYVPFLMKEMRTELKRYVIIFTSLANRSLLLEVCNSIDTDSFIINLEKIHMKKGQHLDNKI